VIQLGLIAQVLVLNLLPVVLNLLGAMRKVGHHLLRQGGALQWDEQEWMALPLQMPCSRLHALLLLLQYLLRRHLYLHPVLPVLQVVPHCC
jgi:hypothetical protein